MAGWTQNDRKIAINETEVELFVVAVAEMATKLA